VAIAVRGGALKIGGSHELLAAGILRLQDNSLSGLQVQKG